MSIVHERGAERETSAGVVRAVAANASRPQRHCNRTRTPYLESRLDAEG